MPALCNVNCFVVNNTSGKLTLNNVSSPQYWPPWAIETIPVSPGTTSLLATVGQTPQGTVEVHYNTPDGPVFAIKWTSEGNKSLIGSFLKGQEFYRIDRRDLAPKTNAIELTIRPI